MLIAPAQAGKGTQTALIHEKYNIAAISIGEVLRDIAASGSELGIHIGKLQQAGILVEDDTTLKALLERLSKPDCENGYVLEGYPRNLDQAKMFDEATRGTDKEISFVILFNIPKEMLIERITSRVTCSKCNAIYSELTDTFNEPGHCNKCGGELFKRNDDNLESFERRYKTFETTVQDAVNFYREKGILYEIDSSINKETTFKQIEDIINKEN
jgi:adenylate kinase